MENAQGKVLFSLERILTGVPDIGYPADNLAFISPCGAGPE